MSLLQVSFDGLTVCALRPEYSEKTFSSADVPKGTESVIYKAAKFLTHSQNKTLTVGLPTFTDDDITTKITTRKAALTTGVLGTTYDSTLSVLNQTKVLKPTTLEIQTKIDTTRGFTDRQAQSYADNENHILHGSNLTAVSTGTCTISGLTLTDGSANFSNEGVAVNDIVVVGNETAFITNVSTTTVSISNSINAGVYKIYNPMTLDEAKDALRKKSSTGSIIADLTNSEAEAVIINERKEELATLQVNKIVSECLEVPSISTTLETGSCTTSTSTLTNASADFVTAGVAENDLVKIAGGLYKVDSVTSATVLEMKTYPSDKTVATSYEILNSSFISQFEYTVN